MESPNLPYGILMGMEFKKTSHVILKNLKESMYLFEICDE